MEEHVLRAAQLLLVVMLVACGGGGEHPGPVPLHDLLPRDLDLPETELLRVGGNPPNLHLQVVPLKRGLRTRRAVTLARDHTLELLPLVAGEVAATCRVETVLVDIDKPGTEVVISSEPPRVLPAPGTTLDQVDLRPLLQTVRIDLGQYQGRRVTLAWRLRGKQPRAQVSLAHLALRRRSHPTRPDILLVCSDAHRWEYALGDKGRQLMPVLQELRRTAVTYRNATSPASWTLPSISSTLTGVYPRYHGCGWRVEQGPINTAAGVTVPPGCFKTTWGTTYQVITGFPSGLPTMGELLQHAGYTTVMVVANPLNILSGLSQHGQDMVLSCSVIPGDTVNQLVARLLESVPARPLLLLVHYMDIHQALPWYLSKQPPILQPSGAPKAARAAYEAATRDTDQNLGKLLELWHRAVGTEESAEVFYADHGEHLFDPGRRRWDHGSTMDEVLLRVPLLIRYPRSLSVPTAEVDCPVSLVDLLPTILDIAGAPTASADLQGTSLLASTADSCQLDRPFHADYQLYEDELSSIRRGHHKLVVDHTSGGHWLIDTTLPGHNGEPAQTISDPGVTQELLQVFREYAERASTSRRSLGAGADIDEAEARESLRALGYLDDSDGGESSH